VISDWSPVALAPRLSIYARGLEPCLSYPDSWRRILRAGAACAGPGAADSTRRGQRSRCLVSFGSSSAPPWLPVVHQFAFGLGVRPPCAPPLCSSCNVVMFFLPGPEACIRGANPKPRLAPRLAFVGQTLNRACPMHKTQDWVEMPQALYPEPSVSASGSASGSRASVHSAIMGRDSLVLTTLKCLYCNPGAGGRTQTVQAVQVLVGCLCFVFCYPAPGFLSWLTLNELQFFPTSYRFWVYVLQLNPKPSETLHS